jgi:hypothetical protein
MKNNNLQVRNPTNSNKSLASKFSPNNSNKSKNNSFKKTQSLQSNVSEKYAEVYQMHFKVLADWDLLSGKMGYLESSHQKNLHHLHKDFDQSLTAIENTLKKKDNVVLIKQSSSLQEFEKLSKAHVIIGEKFDKEILHDLSMLKSKTLKSNITSTSSTASTPKPPSISTKQSKKSESDSSKMSKLASDKTTSHQKTNKTKMATKISNAEKPKKNRRSQK